MTVPAADRVRAGTTDPMLATVEATPEQWARAVDIAAAADLPRRAPRCVVIAGMGGSGVAGDIGAVVAADEGRVPVMVVHDDCLPAFVGPDDLLVLVSHSGGTAETLACAEQAGSLGADVVAVTSGGRLAEVTAAAGGAVVEVPAEGPPRASMALLTVPVLAALERAGVVEGVLAACARVPERLEHRLADWRDDGQQPAAPRRLAEAIGHRQPVFLGAGPLAGVVATRARNQVAENAERPAVAAALPEAGHNQLVGWAGAGTAAACDLVVLRPAQESSASARRVDAVTAIAGPGFAEVHEHRLEPGDTIGQLAAGLLFVDLLSVHLALLAGVDPTPITAIDELKRRL